MHMGLGVGRITNAHVGGVLGRWDYVVMGPPFAQVHLTRPSHAIHTHLRLGG
jgi:hypothetical protein